MTTIDSDRLYFRQLLSGRDFANGNQIARQMVNYAYLLGDRDTGECVMVDPAYAVSDLLAVAESDDMRVTGVLATHFHADHIGGNMMGHTIEGIADLLEQCDVPIHVQSAEVPFIKKTTGLDESHLVQHSGSSEISVGGISVTLVHTPGHTPGSQCFLVDCCLVSGDTLFLEGCGRTDFPGSSAADMYDSLQKLARLDDDTLVFPGHAYSAPPTATMNEVRQYNYVFKPSSKEQWLAMFGADH